MRRSPGEGPASSHRRRHPRLRRLSGLRRRHLQRLGLRIRLWLQSTRLRSLRLPRLVRVLHVWKAEEAIPRRTARIITTLSLGLHHTGGGPPNCIRRPLLRRHRCWMQEAQTQEHPSTHAMLVRARRCASLAWRRSQEQLRRTSMEYRHWTSHLLSPHCLEQLPRRTILKICLRKAKQHRHDVLCRSAAHQWSDAGYSARAMPSGAKPSVPAARKWWPPNGVTMALWICCTI